MSLSLIHISPADALAGAGDILAETYSDDAQIRARLRQLVAKEGRIHTKAAKEGDSVYRMYYDFAEPVRAMAGHRVLAMDRGEREGFLKVSLELPGGPALQAVTQGSLKPGAPSTPLVEAAAKDAYGRLILPAMERETRSQLTEAAQEAAIRVFAAKDVYKRQGLHPGGGIRPRASGATSPKHGGGGDPGCLRQRLCCLLYTSRCV